MISAWWLIPVFFIGFGLGVVALAIFGKTEDG